MDASHGIRLMLYTNINNIGECCALSNTIVITIFIFLSKSTSFFWLNDVICSIKEGNKMQAVMSNN